MRALFFGFVLLTSGCFASHELDAPTRDVDHHARFVGDWMITGAAGWARSPTQTVYRLHPEGAVDVVFHSEGDYFEGVAGAFEVAGVSCELGDRWSSEGDRTLRLESRCSDGSSPAVTLLFEQPEALNTVAPQPVFTTPSGATPAWAGPQGAFFRCTADAESCCAASDFCPGP